MEGARSRLERAYVGVVVRRHEAHLSAPREPPPDPRQIAVRLSRWLTVLTMAPPGAVALAQGIAAGGLGPWLLGLSSTMLATPPILFALRRAPLGFQALAISCATTAVACFGLLHFGPTLGIGTVFSTAAVSWTLFFGRRGLIGGVSALLAFVALVGWADVHGALDFVSAAPRDGLVWLRMWVALAGNLLFVCGVTHAVWNCYRQLLGTESTARREAQEAARARDELLSLASHELRTPLTSLKLLTQVIGAGQPADERVVQSLNRQVQRLERLVALFVDVTSLDAGRPLVREPLDLAALTHEVTTDLETAAARAGSELSVRAPEPVTGHWDRELVQQLVRQVVGNAIKFGAGRPIDVVVEGDARDARVVVRDHGPGIATGERERVFERFHRGVPWTHYGGLGLGLPIARKVARMHGGDLLLQGEPGAGATFKVVLPRGTEPTSSLDA